MRRKSAWLAALASLALALPAAADWPVEGKLVMRVHDSFNGVRLARVFELPSGDLVILGVGSGGNSNGFMLQRISPTGEFAPGWSAGGLLLGEVGKTYLPKWQGYAVDDSACFWHASNGLTYSPGAQLARPEPAVLPAPWAGWRVTTGSGVIGVSAAPAPGGAYIAWSGGLQRLTRSGTPAPGWPAAGVPVSTNSYECALLADGAGGVVVLGATASPPRAQRMDQNAVRHAGWPATGLVLGSAPKDSVPNPNDSAWNPLLPSGPDHMIAGWIGHQTTAKSIRLQRFSLDGTLDPVWPVAGLTAVTADTISDMTLLGDGLGGIHVLWYARGRPLGTHIRSDGTFVPGLGPSGVDLAGSDPNFVRPSHFFDYLDYVVACPAPDGGLLFAYDDSGQAPTVRYWVRWLAEDYSPGPSEPASGRLVYPTVRPRSVRAVHPDGLGGAYLAWEVNGDPNDPNGSFAAHYLYMTRLLASSLVGAPPISHGSAALALSTPRPNPARDVVSLDLTLPDDSPARVELLDVAGRMRRSQSVAGVGPHAVVFADLGSLAPGLYFARATSRAGERSVRMVITK
jgi:hypothetical protein